MDPTEKYPGAAEGMTNEQQNLSPATQSLNNGNEMQGVEGTKPTEEAKQDPIPARMQHQQFLDASLDVLIRRNAAAAEYEYLQRRVLVGLESEETLKPKIEQLQGRLEALLAEQMRLAEYSRSRP